MSKFSAQLPLPHIMADECHVALEIYILLAIQWAMLDIILKLYRGACVICWDVVAVTFSCH